VLASSSSISNSEVLKFHRATSRAQWRGRGGSYLLEASGAEADLTWRWEEEEEEEGVWGLFWACY
jgi:hypothetical protein